MNSNQQLVVRFRPPYSNHMYYIECNFIEQAKLLVDWFRQKGAESAICVKYNIFDLYDYDEET